MFARGGAAGTKGGFDGGGPAIVQLNSVEVARKDVDHFFDETGLDLGAEIVAVHQFLRVLRHSLGDLGMAVSEGRHVNAAGEIDVFIAVDIGEHAALSFVERDRKQADLAGEAAKVPCHAGMECVAFGTWQRIGNDAGNLLQVHGIS